METQNFTPEKEVITIDPITEEELLKGLEKIPDEEKPEKKDVPTVH